MVFSRIVDFSCAKPSCSCGGPELDEFICDHVLYACEKAGKLPQTLLHSQDTLATWKKQYQVAGEFNIPGACWCWCWLLPRSPSLPPTSLSSLLVDTSCMEDAEPTAGLLMPLATPAPRGGVSKKRTVRTGLFPSLSPLPLPHPTMPTPRTRPFVG
jgi:hypothetical protein